MIWILVILVILTPRSIQSPNTPAQEFATFTRQRPSVRAKRRVKATALITFVALLSTFGIQQAFFNTRHLFIAGSLYDGPTYELGDLKYYESQPQGFGYIGTPVSGTEGCWSAQSYTGLTEYNNRETVYMTKSQTVTTFFKTHYTSKGQLAVIDITYRSWILGLYNQAVKVSVVKGDSGLCPDETVS